MCGFFISIHNDFYLLPNIFDAVIRFASSFLSKIIILLSCNILLVFDLFSDISVLLQLDIVQVVHSPPDKFIPFDHSVSVNIMQTKR